MQEKLSILNRLEIYAEAGETSAPLKLWKSQISKLEEKGFVVEKIAKTHRLGEFYCNISWAKPTISGGAANEMLKLSINSLNDNVASDERVAVPYSVRI